MKPLSMLAAGCLCAVAYTSPALAADAESETATEAVDPSTSGLLPAEGASAGDVQDPTADSDASIESDGPASGEREAKNAIYLDLLGPGLLYSINYDRVITGDLSARIGFSYFGAGASKSDGAGTTASAELSYWAIPITASYLGIGGDTHVFEVGGGVTIISLSGEGLIETDDASVAAGESTTVLGLSPIVGYRRQPSDGGFVFRVGASPMLVAGYFLPWGYLSLGAAF